EGFAGEGIAVVGLGVGVLPARSLLAVTGLLRVSAHPLTGRRGVCAGGGADHYLECVHTPLQEPVAVHGIVGVLAGCVVIPIALRQPHTALHPHPVCPDHLFKGVHALVQEPAVFHQRIVGVGSHEALAPVVAPQLRCHPFLPFCTRAPASAPVVASSTWFETYVGYQDHIFRIYCITSFHYMNNSTISIIDQYDLYHTCPS